MDTKEVIVRQARHNMFVSVQVTSESCECEHNNVVDCKIKIKTSVANCYQGNTI